MAKLEMEKIEIIALLKDSQSIIHRLQRRGVVEIYNNEVEEIGTLSTSTSVAQVERSISVATSALDRLKRLGGKKGPLLGFLNGRKQISTDKFGELQGKTDKTLALCYDVLEWEKKIAALKNEIYKNETACDILKRWISLDVPTDFNGTKTTRAFVGTISGKVDAADLHARILDGNESLPVHTEVIYSQKDQSGVLVIFHRDAEQSVKSALREVGFVKLSGTSNRIPAEEIELLQEQNKAKLKSIEDFKAKIQTASESIDDIEFLIDYLLMRRDKYETISKLGMTQNVVVINGYVPKIYSEGLISEFESKYEVAISTYPPDEDDDVPVLLKNGTFSEPLESITKMYALPSKRDVDPSAVMAFFYYLLFGMMLSDAGYGLLMVVGTAIVLKKFTVEGSLRKMLKMFFYAGISTLFWGAMFGSWFGDLPQIIAINFFGKDIGSTALWFEPLDDPIKLLLFSFVIGIGHLFLGVGVNAWMLWKEGKKFDAFSESIPTYLTILGIAPLAATILTDVPAAFTTVGKYMAIVGVALVILTAGRSSRNIFARFFGGLYGVYNVATGYLGDILSYSRLLALGLATGSIASVINLIAVMPENVTVKAIMLIVVGIIGHTANFAINLLGAYVHSDRLQFVELFSKFYEGGGREFAPFGAKTKYIKFEKENIYE